MALHTLKYSKLKNLNDVNFVFDKLKKNELENYRIQISEEWLQNKESVMSCKKEFLIKIKIEKEISALLQQQTSVSQKLSVLREKLQLSKEEKETADKKEIQRRVLAYEQILALKIEHASNVSISESAFLFDFHNINEDKPEEACSFVLNVTEDNIYEAIKCIPPISGMDELILKLNETNDIHHFVINVRKEFCKLFSK